MGGEVRWVLRAMKASSHCFVHSHSLDFSVRVCRGAAIWGKIWDKFAIMRQTQGNVSNSHDSEG